LALTPVEIRHITLSRSLFGYNRSVIDKLLEDIVDSFEQVWRERADLADKIERVEEDLVRYRELETLLRTTLVSAERASQELKEQARRETQVMLDEAHAESRRIRREATADLERMRSESRRIRSLLGAPSRSDGSRVGPRKPQGSRPGETGSPLPVRLRRLGSPGDSLERPLGGIESPSGRIALQLVRRHRAGEDDIRPGLGGGDRDRDGVHADSELRRER